MTKLVVFSLAVLLATSNTAFASSSAAEQIAKEALEIVFTESEKALIREYFREGAAGTPEARGGKQGKKARKDNKGMPPGLAKKESLPPGLQKQLDKNGALPPGLQKKALPSGLQSRLPPAPKGYERVIVDANVLLVESATGVVRDVIRDVVGDLLK